MELVPLTKDQRVAKVQSAIAAAKLVRDNSGIVETNQQKKDRDIAEEQLQVNA